MIKIDLTLITSIINFFILVWLMKRVLYKPVLKLLEERKHRIEEQLQEAQRKDQEAEKKKEEYQRLLAESKNEAQRILKSASQSGEALKEEIIAKAKIQAQEIIAQAQSQAQEEQTKMWHQLQGQVGGLSLELARKIVGELDEERTRRLLDHLLTQLDPSAMEESK
jgi:F-type H+-transporting ATPase subunit b